MPMLTGGHHDPQSGLLLGASLDAGPGELVVAYRRREPHPHVGLSKASGGHVVADLSEESLVRVDGARGAELFTGDIVQCPGCFGHISHRCECSWCERFTCWVCDE